MKGDIINRISKKLNRQLFFIKNYNTIHEEKDKII